MEKIEPKLKKDVFQLEDDMYCLVKALQELTNQIKRLASLK